MGRFADDRGGMEIRLSEPARLRDLRDFFRRCGGIAVETAFDTVDVHLPGTFDPAQELREVHARLAAWLAVNQPVEAELLSG